MRPAKSVAQLAVALLSLSPMVSALAWPEFLPAVDSLVVRQDDTPASKSPAPTPAPSSRPSNNNNNDEEEPATEESGAPQRPTRTNLNTGGRTPTGTQKSGSASDQSDKPEPTMFDPQQPAGAVTMITPAATLGLQLYKVKDNEWVTWVWNYTNLLATPTAVDVLISHSSAGVWTLTRNMTFQVPQTMLWDTGAFNKKNAQSPLPYDLQTLLIHDSESAVTAAPEAGYLSPFSGFQFGLYSPKAPTPLGEWQCATCSGAMSPMEKRVVGGAVAMSIVTVLSFTWFVGGFAALL